MRIGMAVQEEPEEHSQARAGGDEVFEHGANVQEVSNFFTRLIE